MRLFRAVVNGSTATPSRINQSIKFPIKRAGPPRRTPSHRSVVYSQLSSQTRTRKEGGMFCPALMFFFRRYQTNQSLDTYKAFSTRPKMNGASFERGRKSACNFWSLGDAKCKKQSARVHWCASYHHAKTSVRKLCHGRKLSIVAGRVRRRPKALVETHLIHP